MKNAIILFCSLSLLLLFGCRKKASVSVKPGCENEPCSYQGEVRKTVSEQLGRVYYDKVDKRYTIVVTTGTTDAQDVGILCELPTEFQLDGLQIVFDGKYRDLCKPHIVNFAGQTYYYLEVSKIRSKPVTTK